MRTMICNNCGNIVNSSRERCICGSSNLTILTYEQASAATQIKNKTQRLEWFMKGGRYERRSNRRKKWFPVK